MRLWSLHPKYLDAQGLVALWREALLARAVLKGRTRGYLHHPQLDRFRPPMAVDSIDGYIEKIFEESRIREYKFDSRKVISVGSSEQIAVTSGQIEFEWGHLQSKLKARSPLAYEQWQVIAIPDPHPLFHVAPGGIEPWERF